MKAKYTLLIGSLFLSLSAFAEQQPDLVCFDPNGKEIVSGIYIREDGDLQFFNLKNGENISHLTNSPNAEYDIKILKKSKLIITSSAKTEQKTPQNVKLEISFGTLGSC